MGSIYYAGKTISFKFILAVTTLYNTAWSLGMAAPPQKKFPGHKNPASYAGKQNLAMSVLKRNVIKGDDKSEVT